MAINRYRWYVGPYGALRALPPLPMGADPSVTPVIQGGIHRSLSGRVTRDRTGVVKRAWSFEWTRLKQDDLTVVESLIYGAVRPPLYLIDGRRKNILHPDVSSGGSLTRSKSNFTASAGVLTWSQATSPHADLLGVSDGQLAWTGVVNTNTLTHATDRLPVLPGSTYRVSAYLLGTTTCRLTAFPFDAAGAAMATVTSSNLVLTGAYQRFDFLWTPASNPASVRFGLTATGSGNITTTGWQVEMDQALSAWSFGVGCPAVTLGENPEGGYPLGLKYFRSTLNLIEV